MVPCKKVSTSECFNTPTTNTLNHFVNQTKLPFNNKRLNLMVPCKKVSITECFPNDVSIERAFAEDVPHSGCQLDLDGFQVTDLQVPDLRVKAYGQQILLK